jgi:hypothetical protein
VALKFSLEDECKFENKDSIGLHFKCKNCEKVSSLTYGKIRWLKEMNFSLPKYCSPPCREEYHR